jgi:hypothetical protein
MSRAILLVPAVWGMCLASPAGADLAALKSEPNLEKRADKALDAANASVTAARQAFEAGDNGKFVAGLESAKEAVEFAVKSLRDTGKNPSKNSRAFKKAELRIREIVKRLAGLAQEVGFDDRAKVTEVKDHLETVGEELLLDIMGRRQ